MEISVKSFAEANDFKIVAGVGGLENKITCVYICDLLSWVMGKAPESSAWITIQSHVNIVAVTMLTGSACIIVAEGSAIDPDTIAKADSEDIPILSTKLSAYEISKIFMRLENAQ
ncbi:MAG: AraC family transcriptional regulator [Clostridiales bacterium]|jgi:predicted transcriptional regulator|nr:AraC family transcriptional regulator [Clostridiales bacterium]